MHEIALVAAIVALVRKHVPKLDGLLLIPTTLGASLLVSYRDKLEAVLPAEVWNTGALTVGAMGGVSLLSYFAGKVPHLEGAIEAVKATVKSEEPPKKD